MCAYVINLERRPDRMNRLQQLLSSTNPTLLEHLERIDAVDGRNTSLDSDEAAKVVEASALTRAKRAKRLGLYSIVHDSDNSLVNFDDHFTEGAIACAMSHHKALTQVAEHPSANWGLILEDDVSLVVPQVHREVSTILKQLPPDWTAVFLGYHNKYGCPHPRAVNATERWEAAACEKEPIFEIFDHSWGLYAWMVKKDAAKSLIENLFPIGSQVDYAISRFLITRHGGVYSVHPDRLLFYSPTSEEGQDSDIQTMRSEEDVAEEFGSWQEYMELQRQIWTQTTTPASPSIREHGLFKDKEFELDSIQIPPPQQVGDFSFPGGGDGGGPGGGGLSDDDGDDGDGPGPHRRKTHKTEKPEKPEKTPEKGRKQKAPVKDAKTTKATKDAKNAKKDATMKKKMTDKKVVKAPMKAKGK
eukprot:symbB.v1.2.007183.t1/scaffold436.1/size343649/15